MTGLELLLAITVTNLIVSIVLAAATIVLVVQSTHRS